jgi:hypothetical protein
VVSLEPYLEDPLLDQSPFPGGVCRTEGLHPLSCRSSPGIPCSSLGFSK